MQIAPINYIEIREDRPLIAGTGIKVAIIANMHLHQGVAIDWIVENYDLTPAQIYAALSYYSDHAEELDRYIREGDERAQQIGTASSEVLEQMRQRKNRNENG